MLLVSFLRFPPFFLFLSLSLFSPSKKKKMKKKYEKKKRKELMTTEIRGRLLGRDADLLASLFSSF